MIGDFLDEDVRHVGDDDPGVRRRGDVDLVDAHAGDGDDGALVESFDDRPGQPDAPRDDDRVGVDGVRHELARVARVGLHEVEARPKDFDLGLVSMGRLSELAARR